jgi:hypothetical protein
MARRAARPGLGLAVVAVLGTDLFLATHWNHSTPVTLAQSVEAFRDSQTPSAADATTTTSVVAGSAAASAPPVQTPGRPAPTATTVPPRAMASPTRAAPAAAPSGPFTKPAPGVYAYATTGYEKVSIGGARHDYPTESFAAVRSQDGCAWEVEHRVLEEHVETSRSCSAPNVLSFLSNATDVTFFGQKEHHTVTCNPPEITVQIGDAVGSKRAFVCAMDGGAGRIEETITYVGREVLNVGGVAVETFHVVIDGKQSGEADGTSRFEAWVHPATGLPIKQVSHVQSRGHAFGTTIDYTEDASYTLKSLTPTT